jgi:hypothetical protein
MVNKTTRSSQAKMATVLSHAPSPEFPDPPPSSSSARPRPFSTLWATSSTDAERDRLIASYMHLYDEGDALKTRVIAAQMEMIQVTAGKAFIATLVHLIFNLYCHVLNRRSRIVLNLMSLWTRWPPPRLA